MALVRSTRFRDDVLVGGKMKVFPAG